MISRNTLVFIYSFKKIWFNKNLSFVTLVVMTDNILWKIQYWHFIKENKKTFKWNAKEENDNELWNK